MTSVNHDGDCRLCYRRWRALARLQRGDPHDNRRAEAIAGGHQLFFDGMEHKLALATHGPHHHDRGRRKRELLHPTAPKSRAAPKPGPINPVSHRQLTLFDPPVRIMVRDGRPIPVPQPPLLDLAEALEAVAVDVGKQHGWTTGTTRNVRLALRILLALQDTPGAPIKASDTRCLLEYPTLSRPVTLVLEVLAAAGMLDDDRVPAIVGWFQQHTADLPPQMAQELRVWFEVMRYGSTIAPRQLPRADRTTRNNLTNTLPVLRRWAAMHDSLREITRDDVVNALHGTGLRRTDIVLGLRSIFRVLKGRKLVFINPTARIRVQPRKNIPLPLDAAELHDLLNSDDLVRATLAGLMIFHGLRPVQLRKLKLTQVQDGRLHVDGLVILLAPEAGQRLASYLNYRAQRWPATTNPHVFVNVVTANRTTQVHYKWVNRKLGVPAQRVREDRIINEIHATAGDLRQVADMFGLQIHSTLRYAATLNHADLNAEPPSVGEQ